STNLYLNSSIWFAHLHTAYTIASVNERLFSFTYFFKPVTSTSKVTQKAGSTLFLKIMQCIALSHVFSSITLYEFAMYPSPQMKICYCLYYTSLIQKSIAAFLLNLLNGNSLQRKVFPGGKSTKG